MTKDLRELLSELAGNDAASALEALMDAREIPILLTDKDEKVVLANAAACALMRMPARAAIDRPLDIILSQHFPKKEEIEHRSEPIRSKDGSVVGHLHLLHHKSEKTQTEVSPEHEEIETLRNKLKQLESTNEKLRAMENRRNNLLSNVSHELRTPLVTIIGYVEMIHTSELGEIPQDVSSSLKVVLRNALRLSSRIDDLLNLARLQEDDLEPNLEHVRLSEVLQAVLPEHHLLLEDKNIEIDMDIPEDLPDVKADRRMTCRAVDNLIKNALKYSKQEGRIGITAEKRGDMIAFRISDRGEGIPPEHLENVFEPFFQVDSSPTRSHGGIGLGLSIVRKIAQAHGGHATVERNEQGGTTATLELPAAGAKS